MSRDATPSLPLHQGPGAAGPDLGLLGVEQQRVEHHRAQLPPLVIRDSRLSEHLVVSRSGRLNNIEIFAEKTQIVSAFDIQ